MSPIYTTIKNFLTPSESYYKRFGGFCDRLHSASGLLDNMSAAGHYGLDVAYYASVVAGKPCEPLKTAATEVLFARLTLSATRCFTTTEKLLTKKLFVDRDNQWRNPFDIMADVALLPARYLSPASWTLRILSRHEGFEHLKKHSQRVGLAMCASFTFCTIFSGGKTFNDAFNATTYEEYKKVFLDAISCGLNFLAMPWENGAILFDTHPVLSLVGNGFGLAAHLFDFVRKAAEHGDSEADIEIPWRTPFQREVPA